jgi:hypothetical protein
MISTMTTNNNSNPNRPVKDIPKDLNHGGDLFLNGDSRIVPYERLYSNNVVYSP